MFFRLICSRHLVSAGIPFLFHNKKILLIFKRGRHECSYTIMQYTKGYVCSLFLTAKMKLTSYTGHTVRYFRKSKIQIQIFTWLMQFMCVLVTLQVYSQN